MDATQVPEANKTTLGLYVMPDEAYAMWKGDPDNVHFLDVRTFEEYVFGGHIQTARNIPLVFPKFDREDCAKTGKAPGITADPNPDFVAQTQEAFDPGDTILVLCATGGRGAMAVNALARAGFTNAYNVINGFEGDRVDDRGSVYFGKPMRNGWKNNGLPWGYDFDPDLAWDDPND